MLTLHLGDVVVSPLVGVPVILNRSVFGRQTKGIPTHGMQDVKAAHPLKASQRVTNRIVSNVADVQGAARVRQHLQDVVFRLGAVGLGGEYGGVGGPAGGPFRFDFLVAIRSFGHAW